MATNLLPQIIPHKFSSLRDRKPQATAKISASAGKKHPPRPQLSLLCDPVDSAAVAGLQYVSDALPGIRRRNYGKGFLYTGVDGKRIHDEATLRRVASIAIPPAWDDVWICPRSSGHLQATGRDARGRKQYRYHTKYRQIREQTKYDRMLVFGETLPGVRKKVTHDLAHRGLPRERILAAVVRLLDQTGIRIGNREYAKANGSFGLTTLRNRHAAIHGNTIHLRFRGKSGVEKDISLHDPRLARIVKRCQDLPGEELFQYQTIEGDFHGISSGEVNEHLRTISGRDITAKDFRTWNGTRQMLIELAQIGPAESESDAKRRLAAAVKATALHLSNRPATCRKYYIHPVVFDCYSTGTVPAVFQSSDGDLAAQETALLDLVIRAATDARPSRPKTKTIT